MTRQKRAELLLLLVASFWDISYYLTELCLADMEPMTLNAFRFLSAFAVLAPVFHRNLLRLNRVTVRYALLIGLALTATYVLYGYGLTRTSLSNAAFICALPVLTTPVMGLLLYKKRPEQKFWLCLVLCVIGLALLTLDEKMKPASGDLICLCVPIFYSMDLLLTEQAVQRPEVDPLGMGVLELGIVGVITLAMSFLWETPHLPTSPTVWCAALILGLLCSGAAFIIQSVEQKYTSANHVGLIFTLEPVVASIAAFFLAHEILRPRCYIGMGLMLLSLLLMELGQEQENTKRAADH